MMVVRLKRDSDHKKIKIAKFLFLVSVIFISCDQNEIDDDTFADLKRNGPVIKIEGDQGFDGYLLMEWQDEMIIDARSAYWKSYMFCNQPRDSTCSETAQNPYPIQLGADWKGAYPVRADLYNYGNCPPPQETTLYWLGGIIEGTAPFWEKAKREWIERHPKVSRLKDDSVY